MNIYSIPRKMKGESRILVIFSVKALITTIIGIVVGLVLYFILSMFNLNVVGLVFIIVFGLIGFAVGTIKIPDSNAFKITQKLGGENIDDVIKRYLKFKMKKNRIYLYCKEEFKNDK